MLFYRCTNNNIEKPLGMIGFGFSAESGLRVDVK
jgi:hypothetical protein